jgi:hypothetical protein
VIITHDTDATALGAPLEILFNAAKAVLRRDAIRARMVWDGLTLKGDDPLFGFGTWAEMERAAGLRSAFFVFGRGKVRPHINDCRSTVFNSRINWDLLRAWPITARNSACIRRSAQRTTSTSSSGAKEAFEARLRRPIHGVRHHYWALDWRRPHLTFRKHLNAGFRAGTCMPYRPFGPERGRALDIYELPTALMDGNVVSDHGDVEPALRRALRIVENMRQVGGMYWHTEAAVDDYCYRNFADCIRAS